MELELDLYIGKNGEHCVYLGSECGSGIALSDKTAEGVIDKLKEYLIDYYEEIKNGESKNDDD